MTDMGKEFLFWIRVLFGIILVITLILGIQEFSILVSVIIIFTFIIEWLFMEKNS